MRLGVTRDFQIPSFEDWRRLWLDNVLWQRIGKEWPIGWVLETATGEIVGSAVNVPLLYHFRGTEIVAASGRAWSALTAYRGYALWLMAEHFSQPGVELFMETSIGPLSVEALSALCERMPDQTWKPSSG